jgi:hypothetical protein
MSIASDDTIVGMARDCVLERYFSRISRSS